MLRGRAGYEPKIHARPAEPGNHTADDERIHTRRCSTESAAHLKDDNGRIDQSLNVEQPVHPSDKQDARNRCHGKSKSYPSQILDVSESLVYCSLHIGSDCCIKAYVRLSIGELQAAKLECRRTI